MKDLDIAVFISVFQEMLGGLLLWFLVAGAVLVTLAFIAVLVRERQISSRRLVWSELIGIAGGCAAVLFMQAITHSGFSDLGGPIDWLLVLLIFGLGAGGATLLGYAAFGTLHLFPATAGK
ncbi:DUF5368 domain-containing protein [Xanthobacteraceae bacterium Astr-EGSB]|uniref:DUF5368 domain-containing protein n=1 Tax=Astrobacterium formosum TaxID=3069710 RepID=UPI0027B76BE4|nr:DUF5368 domain-containing protein [Xanthobacteraceae bacterium Astr-EGSB]